MFAVWTFWHNDRVATYQHEQNDICKNSDIFGMSLCRFSHYLHKRLCRFVAYVVKSLM